MKCNPFLFMEVNTAHDFKPFIFTEYKGLFLHTELSSLNKKGQKNTFTYLHSCKFSRVSLVHFSGAWLKSVMLWLSSKEPCLHVYLQEKINVVLFCYILETFSFHLSFLSSSFSGASRTVPKICHCTFGPYQIFNWIGDFAQPWSHRPGVPARWPHAPQ